MPGIYRKLDCGGEALTSDGFDYINLEFKFDFNRNTFDAALVARPPGGPEQRLLEKLSVSDKPSAETDLRNKIIVFARNFKDQAWFNTNPKTWKEDRQRDLDNLLADINTYLVPHRAEICGECAVEGACMPKVEVNLTPIEIKSLSYNGKEVVSLNKRILHPTKNRGGSITPPPIEPPILKVSCSPCQDGKCQADPVVTDAGR